MASRSADTKSTAVSLSLLGTSSTSDALRLFNRSDVAFAAVAVKGLRLWLHELRKLRPLTAILAAAMG